MTYRPDIDGLRALAVLAVMVYHLDARWLPGGFIGVDVFFVISGFVVCASLASSPADSLRSFVTAFYARRLARIVPALLTVLLASALAATLFVPKAWLSQVNDSTALYAFFGLSNWLLQNQTDTYFSPRAELNPYTHTWSLGVEEQFYFAFPLLCFLWVRARQRQPATGNAGRPAEAALMAVAGASLAGSVWASFALPAAAFYSILFRFWELAAGALLYQLTAASGGGTSSRPPIVSASLPWLGLVLVAMGGMFAQASAFPFPWALPAIAGTALLIGGVAAPAAHPLRRFLSGALPVWIGKRSYSLYLWHWPVYVVLRWTVGLESLLTQALAVVAAFALASASYRWVELPARHHPRLEGLRPILRVVLFLVLVVAAWKLTQSIFWRQQQWSLSVVAQASRDWYAEGRLPHLGQNVRRCEVQAGSDALPGGKMIRFSPRNCTTPTQPSERSIVVFGDSHATAYLPAMEGLTAETGAATRIYTRAGCPFLDLAKPMANGGVSAGCLAFWEATVRAEAAKLQPGDVVFLSSLRLRRFGDQWAAFADRDVLHESLGAAAREKVAAATAEASTWLQPLLATGATVVFEAPKPIFRSPPFRCSDWFNAANPVCRGGLEQPREALESLRTPIVEAMTAIVARHPGVVVWDPFATLCPGTTCSAFAEGRPLFFDGDHLSAYGNWVLYPSLKAALLGRQPLEPGA